MHLCMYCSSSSPTWLCSSKAPPTWLCSSKAPPTWLCSSKAPPTWLCSRLQEPGKAVLQQTLTEIRLGNLGLLSDATCKRGAQNVSRTKLGRGLMKNPVSEGAAGPSSASALPRAAVLMLLMIIQCYAAGRSTCRSRGV